MRFTTIAIGLTTAFFATAAVAAVPTSSNAVEVIDPIVICRDEASLSGSNVSLDLLLATELTKRGGSLLQVGRDDTSNTSPQYQRGYSLQDFDDGQKLQIVDGMLRDETDRYANFNIDLMAQFNATVSTATDGTYGWSACNEILAFDGDRLFCLCQRGDVASIYKNSLSCDSANCAPVQLSMVAASGSPISSLSSTSSGSVQEVFESTVYITTTVPAVTSSEACANTTSAAFPRPTAEAGKASTVRISDSGRCGHEANQTCEGSSFGDCCSVYGYCGVGVGYCDATNCNPNARYGTCLNPIKDKRQPDSAAVDDAIMELGNGGRGLVKRGTSTTTTWETLTRTVTETLYTANPSEKAAFLATASAELPEVTTAVMLVTKIVSQTTSSAAMLAELKPGCNESSTTSYSNTMSAKTSTTAAGTGIMVTNPLMPGSPSTISAWSGLNPHFNNTATDTNSYLDISTFSANLSSFFPQAPSSYATIALSNSLGTSTSVTQSITTATTSTSSGGNMGFTAAITSNIGGNLSSGGVSMLEVPGGNYIRGAFVAMGALCLGMALLL